MLVEKGSVAGIFGNKPNNLPKQLAGGGPRRSERTASIGGKQVAEVNVERTGFFERHFQLGAHQTTVGRELVAGLTTFMTMAYILFVNPNILSAAGMDVQGTMLATALAAGVATLIMGFYAKLPFALAPGMGLNAYLAYGVVLGMGISWQTALGAVFINGIIFLVLSVLPVREQIIRGIPLGIKLATSSGIGLFIAFIGLATAGIVVPDPNTGVTLGNITQGPVFLALIGLVITAVLMSRRVPGALLFGILITTVIGVFVPGAEGGSVTRMPAGAGDVVAMPTWSALQSNFFQLDILGALSLGLVMVIFTFTFVDMFDTAGTLIGLSTKLGWTDATGSFPGAGRALVTDSIGTMFGSLVGTSTTTTYIESAAGISQGGRTGLTAVTVGSLFLLALFFAPLAGLVPGAATAPILVLVGFLMLEPILKLDLNDLTEAIPAFVTLIMMPLTYSIANGLVFGVLTWVLLKALTGRLRQVSITMWTLAAFFVVFLLYH